MMGVRKGVMIVLQKKDLRVLAGCGLFRGIPEAELPEALRWLNASERSYEKGEMVFLIGDAMSRAGIVLEGTTAVSFLDEGDNSVNMNQFTRGGLFGESLAYLGSNRSPVQMEATSRCRIVFFDFRSIMTARQFDAGYQTTLVSNLLRDFARQNFFINRKLRIMSQKRLRDRIKVYLRGQGMSPDGRICIPFNRNEWAEFMGVNRSALSRELSHMRAEGILEIVGKDVRLLDREFLHN